jgi:pyridoxal phosphate enzyme (YggS family)
VTDPGGTGNGVDVGVVSGKVAAIRSELAALGREGVAIVAVTKSLGRDAMEAARLAGCDAVGENYAQELAAKFAEGPAGLPVHFIGRIQTNKIRMLAPVVDLWQSVDRERVVDGIARECPKGTRVLIQVNATGEADKGGVAPREVEALVERAVLAGLVVEGLMGVGPTSGDSDATEAAFRVVRNLCDRLALGVCSTGMSGDWHLALECGSTMLRLGTALFGSRPPGH